MDSVFGLQGLGANQSELLDLLDQVQFAHVRMEKWPQIAVVGDQSSGKSSVLTSLTGIPFPRAATACTRFPTEIRLRRGSHPVVKVWIQPDDSRPRHEIDRITMDFGGELKSETAEALEKYLIAATERITTNSKFAAGHKLIIEKSGPDLPLLTLIDLPGLVKIPNSEQTPEDLQMIEALSDMYMKDSATIILAVVSGNIDFVQGIILEKAVKFDPKGSRIIGVLTKPDLTESQGYTEKYINLVTRRDSNTQYHFRLGWHVVLNPGPGNNPTIVDRKREEANFFATGKWAIVPPERRGADSLREQLSLQLQRAVACLIPSIQQQIEDADEECDAKLEALGAPLVTPKEMATELGRLFSLSNHLVQPAVEGTFRNPRNETFFKDEPDPRGTPVQNLRAKVWFETNSFAKEFRNLGRDQRFIDDKGNIKVGAKSDFIRDTAAPLLEQIQGLELPGATNPRAPYMLFNAHAKGWPRLARKYQTRVWVICNEFLS